MDEKEIKACLNRMREGKKEAFQTFYKLTHQHVYRTVYFLANHKQDTADIVSEVYIELIKSFAKYDSQQSFRSWLNGLIVRQCNNWHRKLWRKLRIFQKSKVLEAVALPVQDVESQVMRNADSEELLTLVDTLSYKLKEVVVLRYFQENTLEEIAEILKIPLGTVKSRHHLAIQKLRQLKGYASNENKEASPYVS